jgi:CheY-like chemotaxis protein
MISISDSTAGKALSILDEDEAHDTAGGTCLPLSRSGRFPAADGRIGTAQFRKFCILIIANDCEFARGTARMLQICGHVVQCAHTGAAALKLASSFQPEFVLVDVALPDLSGYEIAALLQGIGQPAGLRIATFSTGGGKEERLLSEAAGCIDHLQEPVGISEINAILATPGDWNGH